MAGINLSASSNLYNIERMTLSRIIRAGSIVATITLLALSAAFLGNQRQAQAEVPFPSGFGSYIVCLVFTELNELGSPIPFLETDGCPDGSEEIPACRDDIDNDGDGSTDYPDDPGCSGENDDSEFNLPIVAQCEDNADNDEDGFTDEEDPNCHTDGDPTNEDSYNPNDNSESGTLPACWNGLDDDSDGLTDFPNDPGCSNATDNDESNSGGGGGGGGGSNENTLPLCSDGLDNDGDSLVDLADPDCAAFKPNLTVKKLMNNTGGGTATSSDFTIHVAASSSSQSFSGSASGTQITLGLGVFAVTESGGPAGYIVATSTNCAGTLAIGDVKTCTLTNTYSTSTADVSLTKAVNVTSPVPGATVTFTLTATNSGPNAASDVSVTDLLPSGLTYISDDATTTGSTYATSTGVWTIGSLANGSSTALHLIASVNSGTGGQTIQNVATIRSDEPDSDTGDNTGIVTITPSSPSSGGGGGGSVQCSDGTDNDGDGKIDYPNDPGCASSGDDNETDPSSGGGGGGGGGGGSGSAIATQVNPSLGGGGGGSSGQVLGVTTPTTPACGPFLNAYLRMGRDNDPDEVRKLQTFLNEEIQAGLPVTGFFGPLTHAAVMKFQTKYASDILTPWGISEPTGYVYLTTRKKINEIYCQFRTLFPLSAEEQRIIDGSRSGGGSVLGAGPPSSGAPSTLPPASGPSSSNGDDDEEVIGTSSPQVGGTTSTPADGGGTNQYVIAGLLLLALLGAGAGWYFWRSDNRPGTT